MPVGIDLGTTNSVTAYIDADGRPTVALNADGRSLTPSLVTFADGEIAVGEQAKVLQQAGIGETAAFFKRFMGEATWSFPAAGRNYSAIELATLVLERLKRDAEAFLRRPVREAVITVPAYFMNVQREATRAAAEAAGIEVMQLVNEPTAAAIAYGFAHGGTHAGKRLMVYDLGGGTFDVSLVAVGADVETVVRSDGDHQLGGKDWDERLAVLIAERLRSDHGVEPTAEDEAELRVVAEDMKKRLSGQTSARAAMSAQGRTYSVTIDRAAFETATADLLARTDLKVRQVLAEAGWPTNSLDGVVAVGGSTRMPMVGAFLSALTGHSPLSGVNVDEAVALGAAVLAEHRRPTSTGIAARRVEDVTSHSLGMIAVAESASRYVNSIILPKGTPIPSTQSRPYRFRTRASGPNRVEIFLAQGEHESPGDVDYVGCYLIDDVPHEAGAARVIDIAYAYNEGGEVAVSASLRGGGILPIRREPIGTDVPDRFMMPPPKGGGTMSVMLAFDLSGSMSGKPLQQAQAAARSFVEGMDLASSAIGVAGVADETKIYLEPSQNARDILAAIEHLKIGEVGYGNAGHPFDAVAQILGVAKGRPVVIVLADGVWAYPERAIAAAQALHRRGTTVVAVGFGAADRKFLAAIASTDDASFFTDLGGLVGAFESIAQVLTEGGWERSLRA